MRAAGLSTIQQTLTAEAATVLNQSISEAARRNHGQTTPLHVAATLLSSPSGFLRQACIKSHPNSSHPLQCRALELCFSVALERLPTTQSTAAPVTEPPISNALMAALKRAQAHQRRGCPEQQQQPLLAVKVELEQLVISILDDPSVSRVMREASFSSPAVKATIEQSLSSSNATTNNNNNSAVNSAAPIGFGFRPSVSALQMPANRNMYLNPRLLQQQQQSSGLAQPGGQQHRGDEVRRVIDILLRSKKRNPVLVGDAEPEAVIKELLRRIEGKESCEGVLRNVEVIRFGKEVLSDRSKIPAKIIELGGLIEKRIGSGGILIDLGDLKWLVEQPASHGGFSSGGVSQQVVTEVGRAAVADMAKLLARFEDRGSGSERVWLIGTATCETYLRCQVYHPTMENDWDLQAVPIAAKAPLSGMFSRLGTNGILSTSIESLSPLKGFPAALSRTISESLDRTKKFNCCPECMENYEQELAKVVNRESDKSEVKSEATQPSLPLWLQNAKAQGDDFNVTNQTQSKDRDMIMKQRTEELQKKWKETCFRSHPNFHQLNCSSERIVPSPLSGKSFCNPILLRQPSQPSLQVKRNLGDIVLSNQKLQMSQPVLEAASPPGSPVRTELALGRTEVSGTAPENANKEQTRDFLGCLSAEQQDRFKELQNEKLLSMLDADNFKRLLKGLMEKVWWQKEAAAAVATAVNQCKMGNGKRKGKGDIWLFFAGPDRVGKKEMASVLAELVNGANPIMISLGSVRGNGEAGMNFRGKTALDKIVEAVRRNPFSVIMLEDIDEADTLLRTNIKRAMERGRLADSYGREVSLGNVIFIVTANWLPDNVSHSSAGHSLDDEKLTSLGSSGLQLRLSLCAKTNKRQANWLNDEHRYKKSKKELSLALSLDLNEAADIEEEIADGSRNSSDLTIENEVEHFPENRPPSTIASPVCSELLKFVDDSIIFKPVELPIIRRDVAKSITKRFSAIMGNDISVEIPDKVLEKVLAGLWLDRTSLEEWTEKVLVPSFRQLNSVLLGANSSPRDESMITRLEIDNDSESQGYGDWLPRCIKVVTTGL